MITTGSEQEVAAHKRFVNSLLRLKDDVLFVFDDVADNPFCPMLQIDAALLGLYALTEGGQKRARRHLEVAPMEKGSPQERSLFKAVSSLSYHRYAEAMDQLESHLSQWPDDLLALKVAEYTYYLNGQKQQANRFVKLTTSLIDHHRDVAPFLAIHSFALELSGEYDVAEEVALHSIELDPANPWAHHTLSHTCMQTGRIERGIELFESFAPIWDDFSVWIRSHNLWHLGLFYLEQRALDRMPALIERAGWLKGDLIVSQEIDATALLWRLDMEGDPQDERWKQLAETIGSDASFITTPFVAAHLCYALARAGRADGVQEALEKIERQKSEQWICVGRPLVHAAIAYATGDTTKAATLLDPVIGEIAWVGGSDAQVALFEQCYLHSLIDAGRKREARGYLQEMVGDREMTPLEHHWNALCK